MTTPAKKKYFQGVGRRKRAIAQVRLYPNGKGVHEINGKKIEEYLKESARREVALLPLAKLAEAVDLTIVVKGGGLLGQVEAIRMGIARAILDMDETYRKVLKAEGYLRRDPRVKERKKPGLKKARRRKQWRKR